MRVGQPPFAGEPQRGGDQPEQQAGDGAGRRRQGGQRDDHRHAQPQASGPGERRDERGQPEQQAQPERHPARHRVAGERQGAEHRGQHRVADVGAALEEEREQPGRQRADHDHGGSHAEDGHQVRRDGAVGDRVHAAVPGQVVGAAGVGPRERRPRVLGGDVAAGGRQQPPPQEVQHAGQDGRDQDRAPLQDPRRVRRRAGERGGVARRVVDDRHVGSLRDERQGARREDRPLAQLHRRQRDEDARRCRR